MAFNALKSARNQVIILKMVRVNWLILLSDQYNRILFMDLLSVFYIQNVGERERTEDFFVLLVIKTKKDMSIFVNLPFGGEMLN